MTTFALIAWPFITLILVLRLPFPQAALISLIGGFLLLPTQGGVDLPLLPGFNKNTIPSLTLLILALLFSRKKARDSNDATPDAVPLLEGWLPRSLIAKIGLLMIVLGAQLTVLTNGDALVYGPRTIRGLALYDGFSMALTGLTMLVPLFLGRKFFAHPDSHLLLLRGLIIAGLAYSLLALYEIRMSPQINNMVYGFFPSSWKMHLRGGGYRPLVFLQHGLQLAIFFAAVAIAALGLFRFGNSNRRGVYLLAGLWILGTLLLSNSFGALVIALVFLPVLFFLSFRAQMVVAAIAMGIVLLYPMLRSLDAIPTERLISMVSQLDEDRAGSLRFRTLNEDILLDHVQERPVFGWGVFSRARVYDQSGQDAVTIDGFWIATMGQYGWVGYLAQLGFLTVPIILLTFAKQRYKISPVTGVLILVLTVSLLDLIPNGFLSPVTVLLAGALWGRWELGPSLETITPRHTMPNTLRGLAYARAQPAAPEVASSPEAAAASARKRSVYTRQTKRHDRFGKSH